MPRQAVQSIRSLQAKALANNKLDLIGEDEHEFQPLKLEALETALFEIAEEYILMARHNLSLSDRIATGALQDSIIPTEIVLNGEVLSIGISILSYYKFVDKGVRGWQSGGGNSPYQFKKPGPRGNGQRTSKFVASIRKWLIKEGLKTRAKDVGHKLSTKRDSKRKAKQQFTDTSTRTAIVIAANIRRRGLEPTHFWEKTETEMIKKIKDKFALAIKIDVINNLTQ